MTADTRENLRGFKVVSFESRRAKEMAELIRRYGGEPLVAPSMREIPLSENRAALEFLPEIEAGKFAIVIFMTGVGTRTLNQALLTRYSQERIVAALGKAQLVARGPKPVAALMSRCSPTARRSSMCFGLPPRKTRMNSCGPPARTWRSARSVRFARECCSSTGSSRILSRHIPRWDR